MKFSAWRKIAGTQNGCPVGNARTERTCNRRQTMTQTCSNEQRRMKTRGLAALWMALAMVLFAFAPRTWAQDSATIDGTVADASGAVVANATVTLTDNGTGVKRAATANSVGAFHF